MDKYNNQLLKQDFQDRTETTFNCYNDSKQYYGQATTLDFLRQPPKFNEIKDKKL